MNQSSQPAQREVVIVGGGLAGTAATLALSGDPAFAGRITLPITLLDRRPTLGGRAYSYPHPALNEIVDSQHILLGCCTNLIDLIAQAGAADSIRWYDTLTFLEPNGNRSSLRPGPLPAPSHQTLSFLRAKMLGIADKLGIARGLLHFLRGYPASDTESIATWLRRTHQTKRSIQHFWEPVILAALNDDLDQCSTKYAGKVFHESFLRSPQAGRFGVPTVPLSDWLAPLTAQVQSQGVEVRLKSGMTRLEPIESSAPGSASGAPRWRVHTEDAVYDTANVILAVDFKQTRNILAALPNGEPAAASLDHFTAAPITTIHLWYDQPVIDLDHAVLLDTRIQWLFTKSRIRGWHPAHGTYCELVISASWPELKLGREAILASALEELALFFPAIRTATLLKSAVLKEARATFSVTPGLDRYRPTQQTQWPGLYLAGDWTATEWPSTMEGAVRSGRLAAGALTAAAHTAGAHTANLTRYLSPELPATGLMPLLTR
jgi:zeta-carotene desaturase